MQPGSGKQRREKPEPHRRRWQAGKWTDGEDYESERKVRTSVKQEGVGTGSKVVQQRRVRNNGPQPKKGQGRCEGGRDSRSL